MSTWLLIDCNNFFVSCERVFRPDLAHRPVLVLSSNDGCVVSRSNEVKKLGISMGIPHFQIKEQIARHHIQIFSSNFALYADFSNRVSGLIKTYSPDYEVYSIDEGFLRLPTTSFATVADWEAFGQQIRQHLLQATGIPVTIGIAASKTLAKLATDIAKKDPLSRGVLSLTGRPTKQVEGFLRQVAVNDVWGIGRQTAKKLFATHVETAFDFYQQTQGWVVQHHHTAGAKTWRELHGQPCILQEDVPLNRKQMLCSRSFGAPIKSLSDLKQAVADYTAQAAHRLRRHQARTSLITVFIRTSHFVDPLQRYSATKTASLPVATAFTPDLIAAAHRLLAQIYRPGYIYKKAGVIISALESETDWQPPLLTPQDTTLDQKQQDLMASLDQINRHQGRQIVRFASQSPTAEQVFWRSSTKFRSPNYTRNWAQLPQVKA